MILFEMLDPDVEGHYMRATDEATGLSARYPVDPRDDPEYMSPTDWGEILIGTAQLCAWDVCGQIEDLEIVRDDKWARTNSVHE